MKKLILLFSMLFAVSIYAADIVIQDFESGFTGLWGTNGNPTNSANYEDNVNFTIADNPSKAGINTSNKVGKFHRLKTGFWWALAWFDINEITITASATTPKYLHISVYKPLASRVCVQFKQTQSDEYTNSSQTKINEWEELVFKITESGTFQRLEIKPDFVNPSAATDDIDIYFDNIYINDDPNPAGGSTIDPFAGDLPEDFEGESTLIDPAFYGERFGTFGQPAASSDVAVVDNPYSGGINETAKCAKFVRKMTGDWWAGIYMTPLSQMSVNENNKYFHIMVYQETEPTALSLKLEHSTGNTGDIILQGNKTGANDWTDYVFEIPANMYGTYDKIAFMPDFIQTPAPAERLTEDLLIYFDNIEFSDDPDPRTTSTPTYLNQAKEADAVSVYPDASGNIRIYNGLNEPCTFQLFNALGKLMKTIHVSAGENTIPMEGLPGVYFLKRGQNTYKIML